MRAGLDAHSVALLMQILRRVNLESAIRRYYANAV
jgi:hypothetical protein